MQVLVIGNGGREHALAWKIAQSANVQRVFVAPGNAGTAFEPKTENVPIATSDIEGLVSFAADNHIELTLVGPELPLSLGIVDRFRAKGLPCFGPTQWAAQLESSKAFSKAFMKRYGIPTADYAVFDNVAEALAYVRHQPLPIVIKADGLAAGKGVVVANTLREAENAVHSLLEGLEAENAVHSLSEGLKGPQKGLLVIESFIAGEEVSFIVMAEGLNAIPLATSQDHKTRDNGDKGPNTGGMGAYSPAPIVDAALEKRILSEVIFPTLRGMATEGHPYSGFLYAGLMITPTGDIQVLEFNCRLGDPETQPILMRLRSDLVTVCLQLLEGQLPPPLEWDPRPALGVVLAAKGYPTHYPTGETIRGLPQQTERDRHVFHAGTRQQNDHIVTAGGRVLCVTALGSTLQEAKERAYILSGQIQWNSQHYRTDIGNKVLNKDSSKN